MTKVLPIFCKMLSTKMPDSFFDPFVKFYILVNILKFPKQRQQTKSIEILVVTAILALDACGKSQRHT